MSTNLILFGIILLFQLICLAIAIYAICKRQPDNYFDKPANWGDQ